MCVLKRSIFWVFWDQTNWTMHYGPTFWVQNKGFLTTWWNHKTCMLIVERHTLCPLIPISLINIVSFRSKNLHIFVISINSCDKQINVFWANPNISNTFSFNLLSNRSFKFLDKNLLLRLISHVIFDVSTRYPKTNFW